MTQPDIEKIQVYCYDGRYYDCEGDAITAKYEHRIYNLLDDPYSSRVEKILKSSDELVEILQAYTKEMKAAESKADWK